MKRIPVIFLLAALLSLPALPAAACTLYAAAGRDDVQGGGTILVKNRDWRPQHQEVRLVDEGGWRFYGLFAGNPDAGSAGRLLDFHHAADECLDGGCRQADELWQGEDQEDQR